MGHIHNLNNIYVFIHPILWFGHFVHNNTNISNTCKLWYKGAIAVHKVCIQYYSNHSDFMHLLIIEIYAKQILFNDFGCNLVSANGHGPFIPQVLSMCCVDRNGVHIVGEHKHSEAAS